MAIALVLGIGSASAAPGPLIQAAKDQSTTVAPKTTVSTSTTALSAPTQLAPIAGSGNGNKAKVTNSSHRLLLLVGALGVLALLMVGFTTWFWRATVPTPEALRPLEKLRPGPPPKDASKATAKATTSNGG